MTRIQTLATCLVLVLCSPALAQEQLYELPTLPGTLHPSMLSRYPVLAQTVLSGDNSELFATLKGDPQAQGGVSDPGEIWRAHKADTGWVLGSSLPYPFNTAFSDVLFSLSPDNNAGLMYGVYVRDVHQQRPGFSMMFRKTDEFWDSIRPLYIKKYYNNANHYFAQLAADGYTLLLAIQRDDSIGSLDLYVSHFDHKNAYFSEPTALGTDINTASFEGSPWLAPDMKTLYFSSDRPGSAGHEDVYVSRRLDDTWTHWSEPQRLGDSVNTRYSDMGFQVLDNGTSVVRRRVPEAISSGMWIIDEADFEAPGVAEYASGKAVAESDDPCIVHVRSWGKGTNGNLVPVAQTWTYVNQRDWKVLTPPGTIAVTLESELYPPAIVPAVSQNMTVALDNNDGQQVFAGLDFTASGYSTTLETVMGTAKLWEQLHAKPEAALKIVIPIGMNDAELLSVRQRADALLNSLADAGYSVTSAIATDKQAEREQVSIVLTSPRSATSRK